MQSSTEPQCSRPGKGTQVDESVVYQVHVAKDLLTTIKGASSKLGISTNR